MTQRHSISAAGDDKPEQDPENSHAVLSQKRQRSRLHLLDSFIACGALTVVITRISLDLTGYPQLSGSTWHFAHALWGGFLLAIGQLLSMLAPRRYGVIAAICGGVGFGLFIDEVGKLTTNTSDYFFKFSGFLIYVSFLGLWLVGRYSVTRSSGLPFFSPLSWPDKTWVKASIIVSMALQIAIGGVILCKTLPHSIASDLLAAPADPFTSKEWYDRAMVYIVTVYSLWLIALGIYIIKQKFSVLSAGLLRTTGYVALFSVYPLAITNFPSIASINVALNVLTMILLSDSKSFKVFFFSYWRWWARGASHK